MSYELVLKPLEKTLEDYDLLLIDLWGVIVEGGKTYPGVVDALNKIIKQKKVIFLSNAPRPNFIVANNLNNWGFLNITPEMVITSGDVTRRLILKYQNKDNGNYQKIFHLGADRNDDILKKIEHKLVSDIKEADIFLLSLDRDENEDINEFNDLLKEAANISKLVTLCANPDTTIPKNGILRYCAGYFGRIMEKHGGKVIYTGKPERVIYDLVFERNSDLKKDRILMIGDTFETDILGANRACIHSALVLSGNAEAFHKMHDTMSEKLKALTLHSKTINIIPTFITTIV